MRPGRRAARITIVAWAVGHRGLGDSHRLCRQPGLVAAGRRPGPAGPRGGRQSAPAWSSAPRSPACLPAPSGWPRRPANAGWKNRQAAPGPERSAQPGAARHPQAASRAGRWRSAFTPTGRHGRSSWPSLKRSLKHLDWVVPSWLTLDGPDLEFKTRLDQRALDFMRTNKPGVAILPMIQNVTGGKLGRSGAGQAAGRPRPQRPACWTRSSALSPPTSCRA